MSRTFCSLGLFITCLLAVASATAQQPSPAQRLDQLIHQAWAFELAEDPLLATHTGTKEFNDRLPRVGLGDQQRRSERRRVFLQTLRDIPFDGLSRSDQVNYRMLEADLEYAIREFEFGSHLVPITNRSGFHIGFPELRRQVPLDTVEDYENYIARLAQFDRYVTEHIQLMQEGIERGWTLPSIVLEGYRDPITVHIVQDARQSLLFEPCRSFPDTISQEDRSRLSDACLDAIQQSVVPGYRRFLEFMSTHYVPAARDNIAAAALPQGREFYRHRVRHFTTLDLSPEQVHQTGLDEVQRIRQEMDQVIGKTGFEGSFDAFLELLRTEGRFYAPTPDELLKEVAFILKKMDGQLPSLFGRLPRTPYGIREVPAYIAPNTTSAYYQIPPGDGSRAGFYYVNTFDLKSRPLFEMEALSLHEAVPGHHLQLALQQELADLPEFRRFAGITAFVEGWALYAERLGLECGFYQDPYSDFGRLTFEMWRACRLVVDTGMHYLGWTRQQAIQFMADNTALSRHNIRAEVDRYIAWPGQALAYKIGELKIRQLRELAEKELGGDFRVRDFHDVVLGSGSIPLQILEENVRLYIRDNR
jgi:uncharacterized protein (DUF885 family)